MKYKVQFVEKKFKLRFVTVGFGSNWFEMEPVFNIDGTNFIYTSEEVWIMPGQTKIQRDTLLSGNFRTSSIDSISNLINELKDTAIYKTNIHILSGSAAYLQVSNDTKKINFKLHNASDATADKIVAILNSYIPKGYDKLFISQ